MNSQFSLDWQLFLAARTGDMETGRTALAAGADPNFVHYFGRKSPSQKSSSVLLRAVSESTLPFVEMLLESGAKIPTSQKEQEKLSYAARCANKPDALILLLKRGLVATRADADWAAQHGHRALKKIIEERIGTYTISYDIDILIQKESAAFYPAFCEMIPDYSSIHDPMLSPQERVVRDLWELSYDTANGFSTLVANQHFDTITRAEAALTTIRPGTALRAVTELRGILTKYGFPASPEKALKHLVTIDDPTSAALNIEIEELDTKYFHNKQSDSLWGNADYLEYGMEYVRANIEEFRKRRS